jgi:hypothetical protein
MKCILAALVAAFCLVLTACTTTAELKALDMQREERMAIIRSADDQNTRAENNRLRLAQEREITLREAEKTKQAQAVANQIRYGAMIKIAEKADAGGRVAIARSLEEKAEAAPQSLLAAMSASEPPKPVVLQLPPFQMPKSAVDRWLDVADRWSDKGLRGVSMLLGYKTGVRQIEAETRRVELTEAGNTARTQATMNTFGRFSDNQASQATEASRGYGAALQRALERDSIVINNQGDGNDFALYGGVVNKVQCPQTQQQRGGDGAPSGNGGTSTTGQANGASSGQTAPTTATQTSNCHAGK